MNGEIFERRRKFMQQSEEKQKELVGAIGAGDEHAMKDFFQLHHQAVYAYALRRLNNAGDAADVLNDVMMQVWRSAHRFKGESKVRTWLFSIANYKILDTYRKRYKSDHEELDDRMEDKNTEEPTVAIELSQHSDAIQKCMEGLSDNHRQVVHLAFFEEMAYPDIAAILECPTGTVKTRMMHAKKNLEKCLRRLLGELS